MGVDVFVLEIGVKFGRDGGGQFWFVFGGGKDGGEGFRADARVGAGGGGLCAFLGKTFGADQFGAGVFAGPFGHEDVVLCVCGDDVFEAAVAVGKGGDFGFGFGG